MKRVATFVFTCAFALAGYACDDGTTSDSALGAGGATGSGGGATSTVAQSSSSITTTAGSGGALPECQVVPEEGHLYSFTATSFSDFGQDKPMCLWAGQPLLIVNTAAKCGYTPQFEQLEALHEQFGPQGLTILGFLSDDFGNQGGSEEEVEICLEQYGVEFEQFLHVGVKSTSSLGQHPIFAWLTQQPGFEGEVPWNFSKFLVDAEGNLVGRWSHTTSPDDPVILAAIEGVLGL
jgi:glutathione peroxidase